jgi:hypothetical protein
MVVVLCVLFAAIDQRRLVSPVLSEMQFPISFVSLLSPFEEALGPGFLAGLHPLGKDVRQATLAEHF